MHDGLDEESGEEGHDAEACELDVDDVARMVDVTVAGADAGVVGGTGCGGDVLDEGTTEAAFEDVALGLNEDADALALEAVDGAGAEVDDLLVDVVYVEAAEVADNLVAAVGVEVGQQQVARVGGGEDTELVGVLDVHDLIADVVGGLDEVDEGEAGIATGVGSRGELRYAELGGDAGVVVELGLEEAELLVVASE